MRLKEENPELNGIVKSYNLRGFSFREYLNLQTNQQFEPYALKDIINNHEEITRHILSKVSPMKYFADYIHHGFYPFFLEHRNFSENLLKTMNMMTEVDILLIKQIDLKYLTKIKKLFYLLALEGPKAPNISNLAKDINTSRATVMNYIKNLADARLINLVYPVGQEFPKKPAKVMLQNSNLIYAIYPIQLDEQQLMETFFVNALQEVCSVNEGNKQGTYIINQKEKFKVCDTGKTKKRFSTDTTYTIYNTEVGKDNQVPLWLIGFLY